MADRKVTGTRKDWDGNITALCNPNEPWWSPISSEGAIVHIKKGSHRYYVMIDGVEVDVQIAGDPPNEYLCTDSDKPRKNYLARLPGC